MFAWNMAGYGTILQLYNGYILWAENYILETEDDGLYELRLEICLERLQLKDDTIKILSEDRDHAYDLFDNERKNKAREEMKNTLKIVFISTGTGIVGAAIGIIITLVYVR